MTKTFCPIPWMFQAVRNNGDIRICCQTNISPNKGVVKGFNASNCDLTEARNAPLMKDTRKSMMQGEWPDECIRCRREEESGLESRRMYENEDRDFSYENALEVTDDDGTIDTALSPVTYYDIRFGNKCNLACRMCGTSDSDKWYKEQAELWSPFFKDTHGEVELIQKGKTWVAKNNDYDWYESKTFWDQIEANIENVEHLYLVGGEPLLIDRHYEFLEKCISTGHANHITVEYNTNLTKLNSRVLELWKQFKQVIIGASIDGYGKVFEYQRWPAKWKAVEKNIRKIDELPNNVRAWFTYTVTVYNVFHVPDFIDWKLKQGFKKFNNSRKKPIITHHIAHNPEKINIRILPKEIKKKIRQKYTEYYDNLDVDDFTKEKIKAILKSIVTYMEGDHNYYVWTSGERPPEIEEFHTYTKELDATRNQNILDVVPEFKMLFLDYVVSVQNNEEHAHPEAADAEDITEKINNKQYSMDRTNVDCKFIHRKQLFISSTKKMWPCCYLHDDDYREDSKLIEVQKKYNDDWNNLKKQTINDILSHEWYEKVLEDSWNVKHPLHLPRCYKNCGDSGIREVQYTLQGENK